MDEFIILNREFLETKEWRMATSAQRSVLIALLLSLQHDEASKVVYGQVIKLRPGQTFIRYQELAELAGKGVTARMARTAIIRLKDMGFLETERLRRGLIVTVKLWKRYLDAGD